MFQSNSNLLMTKKDLGSLDSNLLELWPGGLYVPYFRFVKEFEAQFLLGKAPGLRFLAQHRLWRRSST